jgi:hypothetical protein
MAMGEDEEWRDPALQRKMNVAAIDREIAGRADELRRRGVRNPVTQAEEEAAARLDKSAAALNRWRRRYR